MSSTQTDITPAPLCQLCGRTFDTLQGLRRHYYACKTRHSSPCAVCYDASGSITKCSECEVIVHPNCLGLRSCKPPWKCAPCEQMLNPKRLKCELCPNVGGVYVQTKANNKWVHLSCCLWLSNITVTRDPNSQQIIADLSHHHQAKDYDHHKCIHCHSSIGSMIFCLVCNEYCHVTCCNAANYILQMVPLQEYCTWNAGQVCAWLKEQNLSNISSTFEQHGIDGMALGELTENDMIKILDMNISDTKKLKKAIRQIQLLKLGLGSFEFQTLRGVWSLCPKHSNIEYSASTFIKLWKKHYIPSRDVMNVSSDSAISVISHSDDDDESMNEDNVDPQCMGCGGMSDEENFLLCDNDKIAKHGCHIYCLDPPLIKIPNNDWFCPKCDGTKHINKRCNYCNSSMYDSRQCVIECINKKRKKKKCERVCHAECAEKCNDLMIDNKWRCPQCLGKISPKLKKKNAKKVEKKHEKIKINKRKRKKSQFIDSDSDNFEDLNVPKYKKQKIHSSKNDNDHGKIPKIKIMKDENSKQSTMANVWMTQFLQVANDSNVSMKKLSTMICKCLLQRSDDLSKLVLTKWLNEHRGSEKINVWLERAYNERCGDSEKLMLDIFGILHKIKALKIEWKINSKCLNLISMIIQNYECFDINSYFVKRAKECKALFDERFIDFIRIKLKNYAQNFDWFEAIYGKYGSIKLDYAQKYEINVCLKENVNGKELKPGFEKLNLSEICLQIEGMNRLKVNNAIASYKNIIYKLRKERDRKSKRERSDRVDRGRDYHHKTKYHDRNNNNSDKKVASSSEIERTPSVKVRDILWYRVKSKMNNGEIEYYFWNKATNETSWDAPKYWKEYDEEDGVEANTEHHSTEMTVSDIDYRRSVPLQTSQSEDAFATKELLKLTQEMKEESMDDNNVMNECNKNKERKRRDGKRRHSSSSHHHHRHRQRDKDRNQNYRNRSNRERDNYSDRSRNSHKDRRRNYRKHNDRY